jgi:transcriptional regulator with PAS, ATPase and Fis domain
MGKNFILSDIIDYFPFYFLVSDAKGDIVFVSKNGVKKIYGADVGELFCKNVFNLFKDGWIDRPAASAEAVISQKPVFRYMKSRTGIAMMVYAEPIFDENGALEMVVSFAYDEEAYNSFSTEIDKERRRFQKTPTYTNENKQTYLESFNPRMKEIYRIAKIAANADSSVLIYGESGTGKEILANYIHSNSPRARQPFIPVNCAAIPSELIESELFGYSKHAFTGADPKGRVGIFETANSGTLFLDEIAELPIQMQPKLLRVIETGEVRKIGAHNPFNVNVQLIAATNKPLDRLVKIGRFREDLFYRLNMITLKLIPLRDRKEDVRPLADYFLAQINLKKHRSFYFAESVCDFFMKYDFPGNVRELKNIVELLTIISKTDELCFGSDDILSGIGNIEESIDEEPPGQGAGVQNKTAASRAAGPLKAAIADFTDQYIKTVIDNCNGNISAAAKVLGIHRSSIYKLMQNHDTYK